MVGTIAMLWLTLIFYEDQNNFNRRTYPALDTMGSYA